MKKDKSIALLVCYYGTFPWYFNYFIHSCKYNPTIDFFIITDETIDAKLLPGNVKHIYKTINDINLLATKKLGFEINLTSAYPYKLSEFKQAYGLIFSELLTGYDFWGQCDTDVIFGNIRDFITNDLLENYDLISVRPEWVPGCFFLFKNILKMNTLFSKSKDYKKAFTSAEYLNFDETCYRHNEFKAGKTYMEINTEIESMMHVIQKAEAENYIKPFFDFFMIEGLPGKLRWENGRMFYKNRYEILLYHLIYLKNIYLPKRKINHIPDSFTISPAKIYHNTKSNCNK
jgi:hypothetical protein